MYREITLKHSEIYDNVNSLNRELNEELKYLSVANCGMTIQGFSVLSVILNLSKALSKLPLLTTIHPRFLSLR